MRDLEELVLLDLEELVARIALEDVEERLAVVARGREARARHHVGDLAAQERDVARNAVVGGGGEEADEEPLARNLAVVAEFLDGDHVEVGRAMDRRAAVGFVDGQEHRLAQEGLHVGGQCRHVAPAAKDELGVVAQDAEPGLGRHLHAGGLALA